MSTVTMSGADAVKPTAASVVGAAKQQVKSSNGGKALDSARKQAASPVDGQKGKPQLPQPKAWQGPNPITQRASVHTPNGAEKPLPKLPAQPQTQLKSTAELHADKHAYDRTIFLLANLKGHDATLTLKNGEQFTGIFSGGSFESTSKHQYTLKMVKRTRSPTHQQVNGDTELPNEYIGEGEDYMMVFDKEDTVDLAVHDVVIADAPLVQTSNAPPLQNGTVTPSFRTDAEISGREPSMPRERELQRWDAGPESSIDMSLEASGDARWDQFATNKDLYGVESTYDENIYTTVIDRSVPDYKAREAMAARIAREIEGSAPANAHVAEERQLDADRSNALDEEEKYSGVQREAVALPRRSAGAYVPPSQRPLTNLPTVPGAPFDPAIISSSIAKPATPAKAATIPKTATPVQPTAPAKPTPSSKSTSPAESAPPADSAPPASTEKAEEPLAAPEQAVTPGEQTPATTESTTSPDTQATQKPKKATETTAEDHVRNAAEAFKAFANDQKLKAKISVEQRRSSARVEKSVKLNELKLWSERFKIEKRVPDDLVPILAKDPQKQIEIRHRAEQAAQQAEAKLKEREIQKSTSAASPTPSASSTVGSVPPPAPEQRLSFSQQQNARARVTQNLRGLSTQQSPGKTMPQGATARIPTGPAIPSGDGPLSPGSTTKLNVKAFEFRPAASTFMPSGTSPSPQRTTASSMDRSNISEPPKAPGFFEKDKKPVETSDRKGLDATSQSTMQRLLDAEYTDDHKKINAANGGLPKPYQTPPTWPYAEANVNVSYKDSFAKSQVPSSGPSPMHTPNPNGQIPHAHQLPPHLQTMSTPNQRPPYMPAPGQPGASPQVFDPRMQQFGPNGSVQSSPRFPQAQVAFNGQMPTMQMPGMQMPGMQMPQYATQQMPGYGMSPNMPYRQVNMPPGGPPMMMMPPNQQHGQMVAGPQGFPPRGPAGPQYNPQMMGGVPMMQQHSTGAGGFMNGHPMPQQVPSSYSPMPPHSQPHMPAGGHMMPNHQGYGSSPRPHPMQHSGSHQGYQQPGGMMQPPYGAAAPSPGHHPQAYGHYMQQRQMSSGGGGGYVPHMTPRQQYSVPNHPSPGMAGGAVAGGQGDEGK